MATINEYAIKKQNTGKPPSLSRQKMEQGKPLIKYSKPRQTKSGGTIMETIGRKVQTVVPNRSKVKYKTAGIGIRG